ncbi:hypothetical protein KBD20_01930 [Candidatus Saccharibacteria bacterium]|nr:hypothetical protein [Candidatus Saccharibacteria bacterium]
MRKCPYNDGGESKCPVQSGPVESVFLSPCKDGEYGRNCSELLTQLTVLATTGNEGLRSEIDDTYGEIIGHYKPNMISKGNTPDIIKSDVRRCKPPIRSGRPAVEGSVTVHHFDLICTLQNQRFLSAANWYNRELNEKLEEVGLFDWWVFSESDGEVTFLAEVRDTIAEYDRSFRIGSAVLYNTASPPLLVVEQLRKSAITN